jgi:hypothetical protein
MTKRAIANISPAASRRSSHRIFRPLGTVFAGAPHVFLFALACGVGAIGPATAQEVSKGCDAPLSSPHGKTFYIDPQRGSMANDGSGARPWRTLTEVMSPQNHMVATRKHRDNSSDAMEPINPEGPIKPGDTLVLMSGDHGTVDIRQYANDAFISVVAGKQQTPVIGAMRVAGSSHWLFRGLKFQGARPTESGMYNKEVSIEGQGFFGPSDNIVFVDNSFSTADSTDSWTDRDWVDKPYLVTLATSARCSTLAHNHFFNVRIAIGMEGDNSMIEDNLIERFGNDGMDIAASDLTVRRNLIRDGMHTPTETLHPDGIQGWGEKRNVVIDSNRVLNFNHPLQGISVFDGHWVGVTVTNNLVITTAWDGMTMLGVDDAVIANNTVIRAKPDGVTTWLKVAPSKDHRASSNVVVRNNISTLIGLSDAQCDHNIAELSFACKSSTPQPRKDPRLNRNVVDKMILRSIGYDPNMKTFDLRPTPGGSAYQAGSEQSAPPVDITGRKRVAPYDVGPFAR